MKTFSTFSYISITLIKEKHQDQVYLFSVLDCEVSEWSSWSTCSSSCGAGTSNRHRTVTRPESNGGVSCPDLHQAKACRGEGGCERNKVMPRPITSKKHRSASALRGNTQDILLLLNMCRACQEIPSCRITYYKQTKNILETAMILPGKYSQLNNFEEDEEKYDVRQNLKTFKQEENNDQ